MDEALQSWLEGSHHQLVALTGLLRHAHQLRCTSLVHVMHVLQLHELQCRSQASQCRQIALTSLTMLRVMPCTLACP